MKSPHLVRKGIPVLLAVTVAIVLLLIWTRPEPEAVLKTVSPTSVRVSEARLANLQPVDRVTGRLQPAKSASVRFEVAGQVIERMVEAGAVVKKGDILVRLDDGDFRDALQEAEARMRQEKAAIERDKQLLELAGRNSELQQRELQRLEDLGKDSLVSKSHKDEARQQLIKLQSDEARLEYSVDTAASRLQLKRSAVQRAKRNLGRAYLSAPFDGVVNEIHVNSGYFVTVAQNAVDLVSSEEMDLQLEVSGATAASLKINDAVDITVQGRQVSGRILAVQLDPDVNTLTHAVTLRLSGEGLISGTLGSVALLLRPINDAIVVPSGSVLNEDGQSFVFVVENSVLQQTPISAGIRMNGQQVILSGVRVGQQIVASNIAGLSDGLDVTVNAQ